MAQTREEFLAERRTGVGGSDAQHLFDLPPYGCRRRLWYEKTGAPEDFPFLGNPATERGTRLEPVVAGLYAEQTGQQLRRTGLRRHRQDEWLLVHVDRQITCKERVSRHGALEIKCPGLQQFAKVKRQGLPEAYILQLQHALLVTGWQWGAFAVFNAERWELVFFEMPREPLICERIRTSAAAFWRQVENGPAPDRLHPDSLQCRDCPWRTTCQGAALKAAVEAGEPGDPLPADEALAPLVRDYLEAKALADEAGDLKQAAHDALAAALGDRPGAEVPGLARVLYRPQDARRLDAAALRKELPDVAAKYERTSTTRPLRVITL